jgi:non-specific serine/threonine protein kinase
LTLAERAEPELKSRRQPEWLARLEQEHDNLRAALAWCLSRDEAELGQRLAGALWYFWFVRNYFGEGLRWFEKVLASRRGPAVTRAKALVGAGFLASIMTAYLEQVKAHAEESLALVQETGDQKIVVYSLFLLGSYYFRKHDYTRALALDEECLALVQDTGDLWLTAFALTWLGWDFGALWSGLEGATARAQEALRLAREVADQRLIAYSLFYRGECAVQLGDFSLARRCLEESLSIHTRAGRSDRYGCC